MEKDNRDCSLDILKILSMAAVLFMHTQRNAESGIVFNSVLYYGSRFAMPVFFMINGMLIMNHEEFSLEYYKRKLFNMIRITLTWGIITAVVSYILEDISVKHALINGVKCLYGGYIVPFWFISTLEIIYTLLLFFFKHIKAHLNGILILLGIVCVVINTISLINIFAFNGFYIQGGINQRMRLWTWGFYFLLGYKLKNVTIPRKIRYALPIITVVMTAIAIVYQYYIFVIKLNEINSSYCYESLIIMIWTVSIFLTVRNSDFIARIKNKKRIQRMATYSFGVFLLHAYFIKYFSLTKPDTTAIIAFVVWLLLWHGCMAISMVISRVPVFNKLIQY